MALEFRAYEYMKKQRNLMQIVNINIMNISE